MRKTEAHAECDQSDDHNPKCCIQMLRNTSESLTANDGVDNEIPLARQDVEGARDQAAVIPR